MTDTLFSPLPIDPELNQAVERLIQALHDANSTTKLLTQAFDPLASAKQVSSESIAFYSGLDWLNVVHNTLKPSAIFNYWLGLQEIQQAASRELSDEQSHLAEILTTAAQNQASQWATTSSPQQLLARAINLGLDILANVKTNLTHQNQVLASTRSALAALQQQSLSDLSEAQQSL